MADDLEAFLRQAARRRAAQKRPLVEILDDSVPAARPAREAKPPRLASPPTTASPSSPPQLPSQFERRAAELGKEVGMADDLLEERLHDTFDHKVGELKERQPLEAKLASSTPAARVEVDAAKLIEMLRNPSSIRQAILLREILERPLERW